jgi:hypothetical protein
MLFVDAGSNHVNIGGPGDLGQVLNVHGGVALGTDPTVTWTSNYLKFQTRSASVPVIEFLASASGNYAPRLDIMDGSGVAQHSINGGGDTTFNETGSNYDFRVESDNDTHALFVDGASGNVYGSKTGSSMTTAGWVLGRNGGSEFVSQGNNVTVMKIASADDAYIGLVEFYTAGGTQCGYILGNGSAVSLVSLSDYRLKENVVDLTGATERLKQLPVHRFNFINNPSETVDGFLAHEVQSVVPEAAHGTKDAVDDDGNAVMQGIDQSKLVPLLVATIQELEARITALENA